MNPIELMLRLRKACPVGCRVEIHDDIDPHRVRVIWIFRVAGQRQAWDAWMRQDVGDPFEFDHWLEAVEKLMRRDIAEMATRKAPARLPASLTIYEEDI